VHFVYTLILEVFWMNIKGGLRIVVIGLSALLAESCGSASPPLHVPGNPDRVDAIYNSVVALVKIEGNNMRGPYCTASFISPTLLATAAHCVARHETIPIAPGVSVDLPGTISPVGDEVQFVTFGQYNRWTEVANDSNHNIPEYVSATVAEIDVENGHDVALLEINSSEIPSRNWLVMRDLLREPLRSGEIAYSVGMPVGQIWILTDGIISRIQIRQDGSVDILHQVRTGPGSSGAPIMDYRGRIIGTHSAGWSGRRSGTVVGEAKPISYIQTLIRMHETRREIENTAQRSSETGSDA